MKSAAALLALCGAFYCGVARAQQGFSIPSPDVLDMDPSLTIVQGEVVRLTWAANSTYQPTLDGKPIMGSDSRSSLWLTSFEGEENRFGKLLTASVISAGESAWAYEVDLTDDEIDRWKGRFNYRLMKPVSSSSAAFVDSQNTIPSRGFIIRKKSDVAASMASVSASYSRAAVAATQSPSADASTTPAAQATQATLFTNSASPTATSGAAQTPAATASSNSATSSSGASSESASSGGLSTGTKAGIAIGCVAIVILGAIAALLFLRHRRKASRRPDYSGQYDQDKVVPELQQTTVYRHEAPGLGHTAYEMPAQQENHYKAELAGSHGRS